MAVFIRFSGLVDLGFRVSCVFTTCGLLYFFSYINIYLIQKNQTGTVVSLIGLRLFFFKK